MKNRLKLKQIWIVGFALFLSRFAVVYAQSITPLFHYTVSIPEPSSQIYHVELNTAGWDQDTVEFNMPDWMPGYYQLMHYGKTVENFDVKDGKGAALSMENLDENTWRILGVKQKSFIISYDVKTHRKFVANSYVDDSHAYLVTGNSFLYVEDFLHVPVTIKFENIKWSDLATGLKKVAGEVHEFKASDFDILYDCPILIGNLEALPSFEIKGIKHKFIGYDIGDFDKVQFMNNLKKVVESSVQIIGDIPYDEYTFIGIGPGRGGIEHLNNTVFSFKGSNLSHPAAMNTMMNFLAHEYFHHYNVKRIRPFELGPFKYDRENRTNLLWVSEGLTVYYEYLIVKRADMADTEMLFTNLERNINVVENNPGRLYQSLAQASYYTWEDGPFGNQGAEENKSISVYQKGPVVGLLLDFSIRHATQNKKSLDDVMQLLYWKFYKNQNRGFTDAEFQNTCEIIAGKPLNSVFEYVYTTKEIDYNTYLNFAGLKLDLKSNDQKEKKYDLVRINEPNSLQLEIFNSWLQGN